MARAFDNTDASRSAKKSGLRTVRAKLGLLNSALYATYGLKFKAVDKNQRHYHLVGSFNSKSAPKFPSYQTGEEIYWENGKDTRYSYSKLSLDELLMGNHLGVNKLKTSLVLILILRQLQKKFKIYLTYVRILIYYKTMYVYF